MSKRLSVALIGLASMGSAATARADERPLFNGTRRYLAPFVEAGVTAGRGGFVAAAGASPVGMTGLHFTEHAGPFTRWTLLGVVEAFELVRIEDSAGEHSRTYTDSKGTVWKETWYVSADEAAETNARARAAHAETTKSLNEALGIYSELLILVPRFAGAPERLAQAGGFDLTIGVKTPMSGGMTGHTLPWISIAAFNLAHVTTPARWRDARPGDPRRLRYTNVGTRIGFHIPAFTFLDGFVEWDANVLSLFDTSGSKQRTDGSVWSSPLRAGGYLHATDRAYLRAQAVLGGFGFDERLGWQLEAGMRL